MTIHKLKIDVVPFNDLLSGAKTGEVRKDDRGFEVADTVHLTCTDGRTADQTISHIQRGYGLPDGLCVLSYTRAVPDAPELVRYYHNRFAMVPNPMGDYVLHSQAAAIIAALTERLKSTELAMDNIIDERIVAVTRTEAAEAKLAQYEAQEPVAEFGGRRHSPENTNEFFGFLNNGVGLLGGTSLYASPAQAADLKDALNPSEPRT